MIEFAVRENECRAPSDLCKSEKGFRVFWNYRDFWSLLKDLGAVHDENGVLFELKAKGEGGEHQVSPVYINLRNIADHLQTGHDAALRLADMYQVYIRFLAHEHFGMPLKRGMVDLTGLYILGVANGSIDFPQKLALELGASFVPTYKDARGCLKINPEVKASLRDKAVLVIDDVHNNGTSIGELERILKSVPLYRKPAFLCGVTRSQTGPSPFFKSFAMCAVNAPCFGQSKIKEMGFGGCRIISRHDKKNHPKYITR